MLKTYFFDHSKRFQQVSVLLVVVIVAGIGTYLLLSSHAATPYTSITADKGTLSGGATSKTCSGASNGSCVVFGGTSNTTTKMIGLDGTYSDPAYLSDAQNLGVQWMRDEQWGDNTSYVPACQNATQVSQATCGVPLVASSMAARGIHMFPLVNDYGTSWVTAAGRQQWVDQIVHTATTYAKGGTFWQGKTDYGSPVIEVGNEVYGSWYNWPDQGWKYPGDYALMLQQAAIAVNSATNGRIKLLASELPLYDAPDGTQHYWLKDMQAAVPNIESYLGGVVSHPYGDVPPDGSFPGVCTSTNTSPCPPNTPVQDWTYQQLAEVHKEWSIPVYVTEVGQKAASTTWGNKQVGYVNQCLALNYYYDQLKSNSWEAGVFWYNQKDYQAFDPNADNGWALIDNNVYRKPAWYAYQAQALNRPQYNC